MNGPVANCLLQGADAVSRLLHALLTAPLAYTGLLPVPRPLAPSGICHVLVTGASTGIGRDAAVALRKAGFSVWAGVRKDADAESVRSDGLIPLLIDVADDASVARAYGEVRAALSDRPGSMLVAVVANAGIIGTCGPVECIPLKAVKDLFEVNVFGTLRTIKTFMPLIREARGRVVIVGSVTGIYTNPGFAPYSMTKHAMESLADGLRREMAPLGVSVSLLEPGPINTPIVEKLVTSKLLCDPPTSAAYNYFWKMLDAMPKEFAAFGVPTSFTSDAIVHAITAKFPLYRYHVTWVTYVVNGVVNKLCTQLEDAVFYMRSSKVGT